MAMERNENLLNLRVLYVEDDHDTREEMTTLLKRRVGKLFSAASGAEGLALFLEYRPEILILDLLMPDIDGLELARRIRELDEDCHIIITSTVSEVNAILDVVDLGIDKYIIKPINVPELLGELDEIAEKLWRKKIEKFPIEADQKKKAEDEIKRLFSTFLKTLTGKGPKEVNVFIQGDMIDILAYDTLTIMERSMLDKGGNYAIIEQNRKLFYFVREQEICELLKEATGKRAEIQSIAVDPERDIDRIKARIL